MTMRRAGAAISAVLLVLLSVAVAEAALLALLFVFSNVLRLNLGVEMGDHYLQLWFPPLPQPTVLVREAGFIASIVSTFACGAGAAIWRYREWRPA